MTEHETATKAVIHDGNGTWFTAPGLRLTVLTAQEVDELESGNEHVLNEFEGVPLDDLLPKAVDDPEVEWDW